MRGAHHFAIVLALSSAACGASGGWPIERTVGGERRLGTFVAPHSYENFVRGELARAAGDYATAVEHYELARAGAEDDPLLIARVAEVRDALGDREGAERALAEGERLDSTSEAVWMARGVIAERHAETQAAIAAYTRAAEGSDGGEEPILALARVLRESGAAERADAVLAEYLARAPEGVAAARARLALGLSRSDARAAGLAALELARRSPAHADEVVQTVRALVADGHPTLAHRLLALLPEGAVTPALRLEVALAAGARSEAEALLASWAPDQPAELALAARAWLELGEIDEAIATAETAIAERGGGRARVGLARARLAQGRVGEAASIAASVPGSSSAGAEAREVLVEALRLGGLAELADEVAIAP